MPSPPPNIVFILLDDAAVDTLGKQAMQRHFPTLDYIAGQGLYIDKFFLTTPLCGPSRASILSGMLAHNTEVRTNAPASEEAPEGTPSGGFGLFYARGLADRDMGELMRQAGYKTYFSGKYHHADFPDAAGSPTYTPPGWDLFRGSLGGLYLETPIIDNGARFRVQTGMFRSDYEFDSAIEFIGEHLASESAPFFLYLAPFNPHNSPDLNYPERHAELASEAKAPRLPNFNEQDVSDKRGGSQDFPLVDEDLMDRFYRNRVRSVAAIDDRLQELLDAIQPVADNTYIFITSDNGYHLGEHRTVHKKWPYERVISAPMIVAGPDIRPGNLSAPMFANIDLLPTFLDLAGAAIPDFVDGVSFAELVRDHSLPTPRRSILLEQWENQSVQGNRIPMAYAAVRTPSVFYVVWEHGPREYYDLTQDPYQLNNTVDELDRDQLEALDSLLRDWRYCAGPECAVVGNMSVGDAAVNPVPAQ